MPLALEHKSGSPWTEARAGEPLTCGYGDWEVKSLWGTYEPLTLAGNLRSNIRSKAECLSTTLSTAFENCFALSPRGRAAAAAGVAPSVYRWVLLVV